MAPRRFDMVHCSVGKESGDTTSDSRSDAREGTGKDEECSNRSDIRRSESRRALMYLRFLNSYPGNFKPRFACGDRL